MVGVTPTSRKKAHLTKEQRTASKASSTVMWGRIKGIRDYVQDEIVSVSRDFQRKKEWTSMQIFGGGKLLKSKRKSNAYNAFLRARARANKENGVKGNGRGTLPELSRSAANDAVWQSMSPEQKRALAEGMDLEREAEAGPVRRVTGVHASHDVGRTMLTLEAEIQGLSKRTGAQYLLFVVNGEVTDNWTATIAVSDRLRSGIQDLYKTTPEEMGFKLQAYSRSGIGGVLKGSGGKKKTWFRGQARDLITKGLETILLNRGALSDKLPNMSYSNYEALVCEWGVELAGWPDAGGVKAPGDYNRTADIERIYVALKNGECAWRILTDQELEARRAVRERNVLTNKKATGKARGGKKAAAKGKGKSRAKPKSKPFVSSDEEESAEGEE